MLAKHPTKPFFNKIICQLSRMIIFDVWNLLLVLLCFIGFNLRSTLGLVKQERLIEKGMFFVSKIPK